MEVDQPLFQLQSFILFLSNAIVKFYNLVFRLDVLSGLGNEIITYVVSEIMQGLSYKVVYASLRIKQIENELKLRKQLINLADIKPHDVGIEGKFSLDYTSDLLNPHYHHDNFDQIDAQERLKIPPYQKAIQHFSTLSDLQNPFDKLCVITQLTGLIVKCVNSFWMGAKLKGNSLIIDADQNISIIVYIVIKSKIKDMHTQLRMIKKLIPKALRSSTKAGYYLATMQGCLQYIQSLDLQKYVTGEVKDLSEQIRTFSHNDSKMLCQDNEFMTAYSHQIDCSSFFQQNSQLEGVVEVDEDEEFSKKSPNYRRKQTKQQQKKCMNTLEPVRQMDETTAGLQNFEKQPDQKLQQKGEQEQLHDIFFKDQ